MSESEESRGAQALPSTAQPLQVSPNATNCFFRVNVLLEPYERNQEQLENFPFEATVRLESDCMTITHRHDPGDEPAATNFWCFHFWTFKSIEIQEASVIIDLIKRQITLGFRNELPSGRNDLERFADQMYNLLPDIFF